MHAIDFSEGQQLLVRDFESDYERASRSMNENAMNGEFVPRVYPIRRKVDTGVRLAPYETLKEAILQKDRGTIFWLLNEGCPVNMPHYDKDTDSALHASVISNDVDVARLLLSAGAQVNMPNSQKQTALHLAFELEYFEMVDILLKQCDGKINPFTVYGLSHFHIACARNNWVVANAFLQKGVNANTYLEKCFYARDYIYYRPLHLAVEYENLEVAELLMKCGANVDATDRFKRTPLHLACRYNYTRLREAVNIEELIDLIKTESNQPHIIKLLLKFYADIDVLEANGTPPLLQVFKCNYQKIRKIFCEKGHINEVPVQLWKEIVDKLKAIQKEKFFILIKNDADIKFRCKDSKETLLHMVIDGKKLLTKNKECNLEDTDKSEIVDLLCKYGAEIEAKNSSNQTALQLSISLYLTKTVKALINNYADVSSIRFIHYKIPKREPSFDLVEMENFLDIIELILRRKSDLNLPRNNELLMLRYLELNSSFLHLENCSIVDLRSLLDFRDINEIPNVAFYASERSVLSNREKTVLVLEHIRKMELIGLHVSREIKEEFAKCEKIVDADRQTFDEMCEEEIWIMKGIMIDRYASFYDLLFININEIAVRMKNNQFREAIKINCDSRLVLYRNFVVKQFMKGLLRSILLDSAKEYLNFFMMRELPDPCSEKILSYLANEDLCNLILAFE